MSQTNLRVLVVADNLLARVGLAALLAGQPGCEVVGQTGASDPLSHALELYNPDIVIYDLGWMPDSALANLSALNSIPVVTLLPDDEQIANVVQALHSPAYGLLLRDSAPEMLVSALNAVVSGLVVLDPALSALMLSNSEDAEPDPPGEELTPREFEVLQLLAEGLPNKTIAHELDISEHTVKFHVNAVMTKLSAQSRTEAVVRATRLGLIIL